MVALIRRQQPPPPPLANSLLRLLPPEIIQHVAFFLPPSAAASFSFTCVPLRHTIGTQYVSALRASRAETAALLELLAADLPTNRITGLPSRLVCAHCARFVRINYGCTSTAACAKARALSKKNIEASYHPPLVHTAMALHRNGRSRSTDALLARLAPPTTTTRHSREGSTTQHSCSYSIECGSLRLRGREIHIFWRGPENYTIRSWPRTCPHHSSYRIRMTLHAAWVQRQVRAGIRRPVSKLLHCPYCRTVIMLGGCRFRGHGDGLFISWWRDLDDGDKKWVNRTGISAPPWQRKRLSYDPTAMVKEFNLDSMCYFDFDGVERPADRRKLLRLSPYARSRK